MTKEEESIDDSGRTLNTDEEQEFTVEIMKSGDGTAIRVVDVITRSGMVKFDAAYRLAAELYERSKDLDAEIHEEVKISKAQAQMECLWISEHNTPIVSPSIKDKSHRIALSLLRSYSFCKQVKDIVSETKMKKTTVIHYLGNKPKALSAIFEECVRGYRLSDKGVAWVIEDVVPMYSTQAQLDGTASSDS